MYNSAIPIPLYSRVFLSATDNILKNALKSNRWLQFYVFIIFVAVTSVYKIPAYLAFSPLACYFLSLFPIPSDGNRFLGRSVVWMVWLAFSPLLHRHESYKTQYRAMFVMNCVVNKEEILKYRKKVKRSKKRKHSKEIDSIQSNQEEEEIYHPVLCTECSTEVAVMDKDEVFHFFNVLASHS